MEKEVEIKDIHIQEISRDMPFSLIHQICCFILIFLLRLHAEPPPPPPYRPSSIPVERLEVTLIYHLSLFIKLSPTP